LSNTGAKAAPPRRPGSFVASSLRLIGNKRRRYGARGGASLEKILK
jgi:hypothetical protein